MFCVFGMFFDVFWNGCRVAVKITRTSRVYLSLEFVRATDLDDLGQSRRAHLVLRHATLLFDRLVPQEVALTRGAADYFAATGHLELLGNGFACFDHGKNEQGNAPGTGCKVNSLDSRKKKTPGGYPPARGL